MISSYVLVHIEAFLFFPGMSFTLLPNILMNRISSLKGLINLFILAIFLNIPCALAEPTLLEVYRIFEAGQLNKAEEMIKEVLQNHPESAKAYYVASEIYFGEGKLYEARDAFSHAENLSPGLSFAQPESVQILRKRLAAVGLSNIEIKCERIGLIRGSDDFNLCTNSMQINPVEIKSKTSLSPSFDCKKAKSVSENLICSDDELATMDNELLDLYRSAKLTSNNLSLLKSETERAWKDRERICSDRACLVTWYRNRKKYYLSIINSFK